MVAEVIVNIGGNDLLDYKIPGNIEKDLVGKRVVVPLVNKEVLGIVKQVKNSSSFKELKEIISVLDEKKVISEELLKLHSFISDYYLTPLMKVAQLSFPESVKIKRSKEIIVKADFNQTMLFSEEEKSIIKIIKDKKDPFFAINKDRDLSPIFKNMIENGFVEVKDTFKLPSSTNTIIKVIFNSQILLNIRKGTKKEKLYEYLKEKREILLDELKTKDFFDSNVFRDLLITGALNKVELEKNEVSSKEIKDLYKDITILTSEQQEALKKIREESKPSLLFGVTGSGKTEIYIELIRDVLKEGKSVLYMVPEISLINQTMKRIQEKIDKEIIHWHSNMSEKEKMKSWDKIQQDKAHIVLGARSAVFAPVKNLGLIIIDEEHETSYKQNEPDPRYNGVESALKRGEFSQAKVVFGSATPSLERYFRGTQGDFQIVRLKNRPVNSKLPKVEIVDLKEEFKRGNRSVFSTLLENRIRETLERKEQVILFLNRRGFSRFILCRECGHVITCPKCSVPMILHKSPDVLKCHYCEKISKIPQKCPECGSKFIKDMGMGTQKIEALLQETFPGVKVTRMDQDQIKNKDSHEELLSEFSKGKTNILLGTQMVVKGLDFSRVTLVGIISADLSLNVPDLYSSERTFQLLTQVAGRAGRGDLPGFVVIQTYNPDHFSISSAKNHNFESFYNQELKQRKIMDYPPYTKLVRILVSGENMNKTKEYIEKLAGEFKKEINHEEILGPGEAPVSKIKNRYRYHFIIKTKDNFLHNYLKENYNRLKNEGQKVGIRVLFDIDPFLIL
jgi:primosomal protein N' (replication factor Y)